MAVEILKFALYKEVDKKKKNKRVRVEDPSATVQGSDEEGGDDNNNSDGLAAGGEGVRRTPARGAKTGGNYTETDAVPGEEEVWEQIEDDDGRLF